MFFQTAATTNGCWKTWRTRCCENWRRLKATCWTTWSWCRRWRTPSPRLSRYAHEQARARSCTHTRTHALTSERMYMISSIKWTRAHMHARGQFSRRAISIHPSSYSCVRSCLHWVREDQPNPTSATHWRWNCATRWTRCLCFQLCNAVVLVENLSHIRKQTGRKVST